MDLGLKGKVALVTGAGSQIGFGRGIANVLAKEGCDLVLCDMDLEGAQQTVDEVKKSGCKAIAIKVDISVTAEVNEMAKKALEEFKRVDILVNNAGACTPPRPFLEMTEEQIDRDLGVNLKGMINCCRALLPQMLSRGKGKIVNLSSNGSKTGGANVSVYCAAKAGVMVFTKSLGAEVAKQGVNVNCIAPGLGMTGFSKTAPPELIENFLKIIPLGRSTTPEDIGNMVAFLASDASSDVVGQNISVDGGLTMY